MTPEQHRQLIEMAMNEVEWATGLLQGAQSRLKGLLALQTAPEPVAAPEEPVAPSRGAALIEAMRRTETETFGGTFGVDDDDD